MTLHDFWIDPVWSKVIGGLIVILITGSYTVLARHFDWPLGPWRPALRMMHAYCSDQAAAGATYPLKYYLEIINDSNKCVAVRVSEYKPDSVTLQQFIPNTLQIELGGKWLPATHSIDAVALLPNQRCCAWIGVDTTKFTKANVETLKGRIGTLTMTANRKRISFKL